MRKNTSKDILKKLSSKYLFNIIFDYLDKYFKYKLFNYSKKYQSKIGISLYDYKELYIMNYLKINLDNYLTYYNNNSGENYDKNILIKKLENDFCKYNLDYNDIQKYAINYFNKLIQDKKNIYNDTESNLYKYFQMPIHIYSPLFDKISYEGMLEKIFSINISINKIEEFKLKKIYFIF